MLDDRNDCGFQVDAKTVRKWRDRCLAERPGAPKFVSAATFLYGIACPTTRTCEAVGKSSNHTQGVVVRITNGTPGVVKFVAGGSPLYLKDIHPRQRPLPDHHVVHRRRSGVVEHWTRHHHVPLNLHEAAHTADGAKRRLRVGPDASR